MSCKIRPLALCLIRDAGRMLLMEGHDPVKGTTFYRPLGGGIEFGEHSSDTVRREIREEIGGDVVNLKYRGTIENRFVYNGNPSHEIVMIYDGTFADAKYYAETDFDAREHDGSPFNAVWKPFDDFGPGGLTLYPDGLMKILIELDAYDP